MSTSDQDRDHFDDFDDDDELRALLRGGDPVGSLSPADPAALTSLLEDIMSADLDIRPETDSDRTAVPRRRRTGTTWLVAAAAAAVIAGAGGFALSNLGGDDPSVPSAGTQTSPQEPAGSSSDDPTAPLAGQTTELTVGAVPSRCAQPTPEILAQYPQAFQGEVTAIDQQAGTVTLTATDVYTGEVGESVVVEAAPQLIGAMVNTVQFEVGQTYDVAVFDGRVSMCGYSGLATGETGELFSKAFLR